MNAYTNNTTVSQQNHSKHPLSNKQQIQPYLQYPSLDYSMNKLQPETSISRQQKTSRNQLQYYGIGKLFNNQLSSQYNVVNAQNQFNSTASTNRYPINSKQPRRKKSLAGVRGAPSISSGTNLLYGKEKNAYGNIVPAAPTLLPQPPAKSQQSGKDIVASFPNKGAPAPRRYNFDGILQLNLYVINSLLRS